LSRHLARERLLSIWTPTVGHTLGWPQLSETLSLDTRPTAQSITSGPRHRSTNQLGCAVCGNVVLLAPGPSLARQTVTATRQLVVWWPRRSEDIGAGGLISSVLVLTPTIRTHCLRGWAGAGGLISSLAVLTPTIRTHCFRQWGLRPELLGHQFWPRRPGRWHRAGGSCFGHLQTGSSLGDRRWRGLLVKAPSK
jgi:hypothetical protein